MKEFVENMLHCERNLFFALNGSDSVFLDNLMHIISVTKVWIPLYLFVLFLIFYKTSIKNAALVTLFFILMVALCDQFSSGLIKPFFERLRPGHHPDFKCFVDVVNGHRGGGYSFISGHATNACGFAVFLSLVFRHRWVTLVALIWAVLISYSRIYLGMHFVSDVVGGILAGTLIAVGLYFVLIPLRKKLFKLKDSEKIYSARQGKLLWIGFAAYFVAVIIFSQLQLLFR
jgi:undecaprenyl-diphosphatase